MGALSEQSVFRAALFLQSSFSACLSCFEAQASEPDRIIPECISIESGAVIEEYSTCTHYFVALLCFGLPAPTRTTWIWGFLLPISPVPPPTTHRPRCCLSLLPVQAELQSVRAQCAGSALLRLPLRLCETWRAEVRQLHERPQMGAKRLTVADYSQVGQEHPEGENSPSYSIAPLERRPDLACSGFWLSRDAPPINQSIRSQLQ